MFKGCYVALVTPFRGGVLDRAALDDLVEHVVTGGVAGVVPCGTTGESPTLTEPEQADVISAVVKRVRGRVQVIAGTGTNCTEKTLHLSQAAVRAGADAVMLVSPYYNKPNQRGLYEHFSYVARGVSVPIVLYNIPGRTGVEISIETIARLHADHKNIVAVKHATGSVEGASELVAVSDITILSGDDPLTLPLMSIGATGVISVLGNLLPTEMSCLCRAALAGDWDEARAWHEKLLPISRELLKMDVNPIPIKAALAHRGMMAEEYRLPLVPLESTKRERLAALVDKYCLTPKARQIA